MRQTQARASPARKAAAPCANPSKNALIGRPWAAIIADRIRSSPAQFRRTCKQPLSQLFLQAL